MRHLHIALVAIAANPYHPSEAGLGWKSILALASGHRLTVFTHGNNRKDIETYRQSPECPFLIHEVEFIFVAKPHGYHRNEAVARMMNWHYYRQWLAKCVTAISNCASSSGFDLVHHVTYSTWRMGSPFYKTGLPTVWGPVGGAGNVPFSAFGMLSLTGRCTEALRGALSLFFRFSPAFRRSLALNTVILASNEETRRFLERYTRNRINVVFPTYFQEREAGLTNEHHATGPLRCFYGGGIIGSKGISLSLKAIATAIGTGADIQFKIAGHGPEREHLMELAQDLGISEQVTFLPLLSGNEYQEVLKEAQVFLFPSFRENIGITMVDAMLHYTVPVVLDTSAPGEIVTGDCGWKVCLSTPARIVASLHEVLMEAYSNRGMVIKKGLQARQRILETYSREDYLARVEAAYSKALGLRDDNSSKTGDAAVEMRE